MRISDWSSDVCSSDLLSADVLPRIHDRVRHRTSESSCGLCGLENLEQAMRPLPVLPDTWPLAEKALFAALAALDEHQPLNRATGGVHAAALCSADGDLKSVDSGKSVSVRVDIGGRRIIKKKTQHTN